MLLGAFGPFFTFSYQSSESHPVTRISHLASRTSHLAPRTSYLVSRISYLVSRISHLVSRILHLAPRISHHASRISDQSLTKSWISHLLAFRKDRSRFYQPAFFGSGFNYLRYFLVDSAYLLLISVGKRPKLAFIAD